MGLKQEFWQDRSVFLTGHTGFKGGWLALWLTKLGARVYGYSLQPSGSDNFFNAVQLESHIHHSEIGDIRDFSGLSKALLCSNASVVLHLAAQPLVRESYNNPIETYQTNVMGTLNLLEAVRHSESVKAIVSVTTDKCYENKEWDWPYRENDALGGYDPYSSSKACAELATAAYRNSFLRDANIDVATARAGNVIGGGDWAKDRLIPDFFRAADSGEPLCVRSPDAIRPWQHVLEPLQGYLTLAEKLYGNGESYSTAWNFGPAESDAKPVSWILDKLCQKMPESSWGIENSQHPHEAGLLKLDSSMARKHLDWTSRWSLDAALTSTVLWYQAWRRGEDMHQFSMNQIEIYQNQ